MGGSVTGAESLSIPLTLLMHRILPLARIQLCWINLCPNRVAGISISYREGEGLLLWVSYLYLRCCCCFGFFSVMGAEK